MDRSTSLRRSSPGFTLLEVALIVAIIGMMLLMIIGYLFAPKAKAPVLPKQAPKATPAAATPVATPTPEPPATKTIELPPASVPTLR